MDIAEGASWGNFDLKAPLVVEDNNIRGHFPGKRRLLGSIN